MNRGNANNKPLDFTNAEEKEMQRLADIEQRVAAKTKLMEDKRQKRIYEEGLANGTISPILPSIDEIDIVIDPALNWIDNMKLNGFSEKDIEEGHNDFMLYLALIATGTISKEEAPNTTQSVVGGAQKNTYHSDSEDPASPRGNSEVEIGALIKSFRDRNLPWIRIEKLLVDSGNDISVIKAERKRWEQKHPTETEDEIKRLDAIKEKERKEHIVILTRRIFDVKFEHPDFNKEKVLKHLESNNEINTKSNPESGFEFSDAYEIYERKSQDQKFVVEEKRRWTQSRTPNSYSKANYEMKRKEAYMALPNGLVESARISKFMEGSNGMQFTRENYNIEKKADTRWSKGAKTVLYGAGCILALTAVGVATVFAAPVVLGAAGLGAATSATAALAASEVCAISATSAGCAAATATAATVAAHVTTAAAVTNLTIGLGCAAGATKVVMTITREKASIDTTKVCYNVDPKYINELLQNVQKYVDTCEGIIKQNVQSAAKERNALEKQIAKNKTTGKSTDPKNQALLDFNKAYEKASQIGLAAFETEKKKQEALTPRPDEQAIAEAATAASASATSKSMKPFCSNNKYKPDLLPPEKVEICTSIMAQAGGAPNINQSHEQKINTVNNLLPLIFGSESMDASVLKYINGQMNRINRELTDKETLLGKVANVLGNEEAVNVVLGSFPEINVRAEEALNAKLNSQVNKPQSAGYRKTQKRTHRKSNMRKTRGY